MLAFDLTFKAFDPSAITQVQHAVQLLVKQVQISGGGDKICIVGLPTTKKAFTVLRSPHVHKKSREQFVMHIYQRQIKLKESLPVFTKHELIFACKNLLGAQTQMKQSIVHSSKLWTSFS